MPLLHATCVEIEGDGILLRGPSGSGKSDLALRLIDGGAALVADDQVEVEAEGAELMARSPAPLQGLLEVRGFGLVHLPFLEQVVLRALFDLTPGEVPPRLPRARTVQIEGLPLPHFSIDPFHASAPALIRIAARAGWQTPDSD